MATTKPVFFDCEASSLEGFPIEIGWAFLDSQTGQIQSEAHFIRPAATWDIERLWDPEAQVLHGITREHLKAHGKEPAEILRRMNSLLWGLDLFGDDSKDEIWIKQLIKEAGLAPSFTVRQKKARDLTAEFALGRGYRACGHLSQARAQTRWMPARKFRAVFS